MGELVVCDAVSDSASLNNPEELERVCLSALYNGHCNIISGKKIFHQFTSDNKHADGVTGLIIIKESHFHISTWPEEKYIQIDINTCGDTAKPLIVLGHLLYALQVRKASLKVEERGVPQKS